MDKLPSDILFLGHNHEVLPITEQFAQTLRLVSHKIFSDQLKRWPFDDDSFDGVVTKRRESIEILGQEYRKFSAKFTRKADGRKFNIQFCVALSYLQTKPNQDPPNPPETSEPSPFSLN